jgi:hypothetical protein
MSRQRPNGEAGNLAAALGGVLVLVSLFLAWYTEPGFTVTGWTAFEVWDVVLALIAVATILSAATRLGWWRGPVHAVNPVILGSTALVIVASQLIDRPPAVLHGGIGSGGWLALVGAGLIVVGVMVADSRLTVSFTPVPAATGAADPEARSSTPAWRRSRVPTDGTRTAADPVARPAAGPAPVPLVGGEQRAPGTAVPPAGRDDPTVAVRARSPRRPRGT